MSEAPRVVPRDQADRDRIRLDHEHTLFVEAGAGTGKTTALVSRIVALVTVGLLEMEGLAAITFTEAAAAELRDRVRRELVNASRDAGSSLEERLRRTRAAGEVELAAIQTIHAFAGTLLRTFPIEARVPPGFEIWDDVRTRLDFEERFRAWLYDDVPNDLPTGNPRRTVIRRALALGLTFNQLEALAQALQEHTDLLQTPDPDHDQTEDAENGILTDVGAPATTGTVASANDVGAVGVANRCGRTIIDVLPLAGFARLGGDDPLVQELRRLEPVATRLTVVRDEIDALVALQELGKVAWNKGNQSNWGSGPNRENVLRSIKGSLRQVTEEVENALVTARRAVLADLLGYLRTFTVKYVDDRRRRGAATFHDLLVWARDMLRDSAAARTQARRRFQRIFVDEFQDTDPLQAEIVWLLAADTDSPLTTWRDARPAPGKLFVVGDPKQSIYRFRRADIGIYTRVYGDAPPDNRTRLIHNFRSVPAILDWVNDYFGLVMIEKPGVQAPYVALSSTIAREQANVAAGVTVFGERLEGNMAEIRRIEAEDVARLARQAVSAGWIVRDITGGCRPARYEDICVLMPRRTNLSGLEEAFERYEVPYRVESGSLILDTPEVWDLLSGLRAIDDPSDQVALVAVLRSPAYACSDVDLLDWVERGGKLDYEQPLEGLDGPVAEAFASLRDFHRLRIDRSVAATIEAYVHERMLAVQVFGQPRPREAWRRIRYIIGQARAWAAAGRPTLRTLLDWLDNLQRAQVRDLESPVPEADEDAVRILTIHGAKGLEFPIVVLTELGAIRQSRGESVRIIADREKETLEVKVGAFATAGFDPAAARENEIDDAEYVRLLYVAATRARDHLVLSLYHAKPQSVAGQILERLQADDHPAFQCLALSDSQPASIDDVGEPAETSTPEEHALGEKEWLTKRQEEIGRLAALPHITVTDLVARANLNQDEQSDRQSGAPLQSPVVVEPDGLPELPITDDSNVVRAVHLAIQAIGQSPSPDIDAIVAWAAQSHGVTLQMEDVNRLVRAVWRGPLLAAARSGKLWQEIPFGAEVDGVLVEGLIDLIYERPEGALAIVVFMADEVDRGEIAGRAASLRLQGGASALLVERVTGRQVGKVEFVFASLDGYAVVYQDVPALIAEARAALRQ